tara:strand:- start:1173 stop:2027 length:855 start_codon:yes stop_codon:yes gene_type:complete
MAKKAAGFTRSDAERILQATAKVEASPSGSFSSGSPSRAFIEPISLAFRNTTGETIPPYGVFRYGLTTVFERGLRPIWKAVKPSNSNQGLEAGVNSSNPVPDGEFGVMQTDSLVKVRWETPTDWPFEAPYPYAGLTCGATNTFSANFYGNDFIAKGVATQSTETSAEIRTIIATPIPKSTLFQVGLDVIDADYSLNGTSEEPAQYTYNIRYLKTDSQVSSLQPYIHAGLDPNQSTYSSWRRPMLGRVRIATRGVGAWKTYAIGNQLDRKFDLVYANEISQFTTC